jgi:hypothetical protein
MLLQEMSGSGFSSRKACRPLSPLLEGAGELVGKGLDEVDVGFDRHAGEYRTIGGQCAGAFTIKRVRE